MVQRLLITHAQIYGLTEVWPTGWLLTEGQQIKQLGAGQPPEFPAGFISEQIDAGGFHLLPGFIDIHVHGGNGHELMDATPAGLQAMARFFAQHGVTSFLPTTWTATRSAITRALTLVAELVGPVPGGATILGAHVEGPYLNPEKCGAQDVSLIRRAARDEALEFLETGVVRLLALAPEYPENHWLIEECARRGITVSAAHTAATYAQMQNAVRLGLRHATHSFNAMLGLNHREPGTVGAILTLPEINCELIADNVHVHPAVQNLLLKAKGPRGVILITDAVRAAGLPEGEYQIDTRTVRVQGGAVRLLDGQLAGSVLTMETALKNFRQATGLSLQDAWPATSLNAARAIGVAERKGSLAVGKDADLVLLDDAGHVRTTIAEGVAVYRAF
jgi:N-acetylglucosamine-6-phosphate deacetylase